MSDKLKYILKVVILFLAFSLQCTVLSAVEISGVRPNLVLICIIALSLFSDQLEIIIYGAAFGALTDLIWGQVFGVHTLLMLYLAFVCGILNRRLYSENYVTMCLYAFLTTCLYESVFAVITFFMWGHAELAGAIILKILIQAVYNAVVMVPLFAIAKRIFKSNRGQYYNG